MKPKSAFITTGEGNTGQYCARQFGELGDFENVTVGYNQKYEDRLPDPSTRGYGYSFTPYDASDTSSIASAMTNNGTHPDVVLLIPPSYENKIQITKNFIEACQKEKVEMVVLVSCVGADEGGGKDRKKEHLAEFVDLERLVTEAGFKRYCIVRPSFYTQNLLLYADQMKRDAVIPLPIGRGSFTPVDLTDVAYGLEKICHTIDQKHHSQVYIFMGPETIDGPGLVDIATKITRTQFVFKDISPTEALNLLHSEEVKSTFKLDEPEIGLLMELYDLIRELKLGYFIDDLRTVCGSSGTDLERFFMTNDHLLNPNA